MRDYYTYAGLLTLQITRAAQLCVATWNTYPAVLVRVYSERWALREMRRSCKVPAMSSVATVLL